jgi:hypothetical protein
MDKLCPKFADENVSEIFLAETGMHKIDPWMAQWQTMAIPATHGVYSVAMTGMDMPLRLPQLFSQRCGSCTRLYTEKIVKKKRTFLYSLKKRS